MPSGNVVRIGAQFAVRSARRCRPARVEVHIAVAGVAHARRHHRVDRGLDRSFGQRNAGVPRVPSHRRRESSRCAGIGRGRASGDARAGQAQRDDDPAQPHAHCRGSPTRVCARCQCAARPLGRGSSGVASRCWRMRQLKIALTAAQAALDRWAAQPHASVAVFHVSVFADCGHSWHGPGVTRPDIATSQIATAAWRFEFGFEGHIAMAEAMT